MKIEIYTVDYCPFCKKALNFLKEKNASFTQIKIDEDESTWFKKLGEMFNIKGEVTVPQIVLDGKPIGGYTDMMELNAKGQFLN